MFAGFIKMIWILLKNTPVLSNLTFFLLRNSRYLFWRFRGPKEVQLGPANIKFIETVKREIGSDNNFKLIEFGCAAGPSLIELAENYKSSKFFGFDIRKGAVEEGKIFLNHNRINNVTLFNSNLVDLNDEISCDYIISRATLIYLSPKDLRNLLSKIKTRVDKKIIFQEIHSFSNDSVNHYYFAHPFVKIFKELGYEEFFTISMEKLNFERWDSKEWFGVNLILTRK
tara:strand:+ start:22199 stop:22879 length:681 start_codon:yes stop_codon:yes gene_type:complete